MKTLETGRAALMRGHIVVCCALFMALMLLATTGLYGCSSKTQAATESLESTLQSVQNQDADVIGKYLTAVWFDPTLYSVSNETFTQVYFDDFSYEIEKAEENTNGSVTATVKLHSYNMAQVLDDLYAATEEAYADIDADSEQSTELQDADPFFLEYADAHTWDTTEGSYEIVMIQDDEGAWHIESPATFGAILLNGYDPRQLMSDD